MEVILDDPAGNSFIQVNKKLSRASSFLALVNAILTRISLSRAPTRVGPCRRKTLVSIRNQTVKLHNIFDHLKHSLIVRLLLLFTMVKFQPHFACQVPDERTK